MCSRSKKVGRRKAHTIGGDCPTGYIDNWSTASSQAYSLRRSRISVHHNAYDSVPMSEIRVLTKSPRLRRSVDSHGSRGRVSSLEDNRSRVDNGGEILGKTQQGHMQPRKNPSIVGTRPNRHIEYNQGIQSLSGVQKKENGVSKVQIHRHSENHVSEPHPKSTNRPTECAKDGKLENKAGVSEPRSPGNNLAIV